MFLRRRKKSCLTLSPIDDTGDLTQPVSEEIHNLEIPLIKRRRPTLEGAQRWLRKEINAPWMRNTTKGSGQLRPDMASSRSSPVSFDGHSQNPSTVSSTEIFRFGITRRR